MGFREKMLWGSMAATLLIWGWYFIGFARALRAGTLDPGVAFGSFVLTVIVLVVVEVAVAVVLAIASGREAEAPADDREKAYAVAAYRPAYFVLVTLIVALMLTAPIALRIGMEIPDLPKGLASVLLGNALLASLVAAELVHSGAQLLRYRLGG